MSKIGRPSEYMECYPEQIYTLMTQGKLDCQICMILDISRDTFYRWINEKSEFKEAHDRGLMACEAWWCDKGQSGMDGKIKGFSFNAWIAFMNNKFKWAKNALTDPAQLTQNINIGSVNILQQKSREDLLSYISTLSDKHQEVLDVQFTKQDNKPA